MCVVCVCVREWRACGVCVRVCVSGVRVHVCACVVCVYMRVCVCVYKYIAASKQDVLV